MKRTAFVTVLFAVLLGAIAATHGSNYLTKAMSDQVTPTD